jgi:5-methylcytosine-specific restriction endonuclease McrA
MGRKKTGLTAICPVCKKPYHRPQHNIDKGTQLTCSFACNAIRKRGEGNHYFGKKHSDEIRKKISESVLANPPKGTGPKKGVFKHTDEAKAKMSAALRERWRTRRADMLSYIKRGLNTPYDAINPKPRWKVCFTRTQKRDWIGTKCAWCKSTKELVLDHTIPVICGGINEKTNAQTLCQSCNCWKMRHVDRPLYFALLASNRG